VPAEPFRLHRKCGPAMERRGGGGDSRTTLRGSPAPRPPAQAKDALPRQHAGHAARGIVCRGRDGRRLLESGEGHRCALGECVDVAFALLLEWGPIRRRCRHPDELRSSVRARQRRPRKRTRIRCQSLPGGAVRLSIELVGSPAILGRHLDQLLGDVLRHRLPRQPGATLGLGAKSICCRH
jgi:hypothetical protein